MDRETNPSISAVKVQLADAIYIIFRVGSGKSTLIKSLLGETKIIDGSLQSTSGFIAYCDQTPWLMNASLKNNILGQSEFDQRWYDTVTNACCLLEDFSALPRGDESLVGSKGYALSGGQKQRVVSANQGLNFLIGNNFRPLHVRSTRGQTL